MKTLTLALISSIFSFNTYAYTVLAKLECTSPGTDLSVATYEIRKGDEAGQGRALVVNVTYENEEEVTLFQDMTPYWSFDYVKEFVVSGDCGPGSTLQNISLITLETKDKKNFKGQMSLAGQVYSLSCKKVK